MLYSYNLARNFIPYDLIFNNLNFKKMTFEIYTKFKCNASESIQFAAFAHVLYYDVGKLHCAILYVHFSLSLSMITL